MLIAMMSLSCESYVPPRKSGAQWDAAGAAQAEPLLSEFVSPEDEPSSVKAARAQRLSREQAAQSASTNGKTIHSSPGTAPAQVGDDTKRRDDKTVPARRFTERDREVVSRVNKRPIYRYLLEDMLIKQHPDFLEQSYRRLALKGVASERGIVVGEFDTAQYIRDFSEQLKKSSDGRMTLERWLSSNNMTMENFLDMARDEIIVGKLKQSDFKGTVPSQIAYEAWLTRIMREAGVITDPHFLKPGVVFKVNDHEEPKKDFIARLTAEIGMPEVEKILESIENQSVVAQELDRKGVAYDDAVRQYAKEWLKRVAHRETPDFDGSDEALDSYMMQTQGTVFDALEKTEDFRLNARMRYHLKSQIPLAEANDFFNRYRGIVVPVFSDWASRYSEHKTATQGGRLEQPVALARLHPQFKTAIKDLPPGATSQPVKTDNGWAIFKILERNGEYVRLALIWRPSGSDQDRKMRETFEKLRRQIDDEESKADFNQYREQVYDRLIDARRSKWIEELRTLAIIKRNL